MKKTTGLGKGLSALLDDAQSRRRGNGENLAAGGVMRISISDIRPNPKQPRRHFDEEALQELADSIARDGVLQPIIVRPEGDGYELIAGERRWRAAQKAQLHDIPSLVRESDAEHSAELAIIENIQREDLNAIEEAAAYKALMNAYGHGQAEVGEIVGKSRSHVANLLRLLDLPNEVQEMLLRGDISMGHARAAAGAEDPRAVAKAIVSGGLSVRQAEDLARSAKSPKKSSSSTASASPVDADIAALQRQLGDMLGLRVRVLHGKGGGKVELQYRTLDQLDMICQRLSGEPI